MENYLQSLKQLHVLANNGFSVVRRREWQEPNNVLSMTKNGLQLAATIRSIKPYFGVLPFCY
jgi:hypothetical protein